MSVHTRERFGTTYQLLKPVRRELSGNCGAGPASGVAGAAWDVAIVNWTASPIPVQARAPTPMKGGRSVYPFALNSSENKDSASDEVLSFVFWTLSELNWFFP